MIRPRQRPARAEVVTVAAAAPPAASPRPAPRGAPAKKARRSAQKVSAVPAATRGRPGALCGDPAIFGKLVEPVAGKLQGCGLIEGVAVGSVSGVALSTPAMIDCVTAKALKTWIDGGVKPAFGQRRGGVAALEVAASYTCRGRNNQKGAKVSEHGRGRAIDISGFRMRDGTTVSVLNDWKSPRTGKTLAEARRAACGPFSTVLGPGSDRHHDDHFHLDTARGRGAYCR